MRNLLLTLILVSAAAVRGLYLVGIWNTHLAGIPIIDAAYYHNLAASLAVGMNGEEGVFFMSPLLSAVLSVFYKIFGVFPQVGLVIHALCGVLIVYLIYRIGVSLFDQNVGLLSAFLAAFYRPFIYYEGVLLTATLILVLNAVMLLLLLSKNRGGWIYLLAGVLLGVSALARPDILLFGVMLAALFALSPGRFGLRCSFILIAGVALVLFPTTYRNYASSGHFVLVTAGAGMNFYAGNNPQAEGIYWEAPFIRSAEPDFENQDYRMEASRRAGTDLDVVQTSKYWLEEGLKFIVNHPVSYLQLLLKKLFLFFHHTEIPNNLSIYVAMAFSRLLRLLPFTFGLLAPVGFAFWLQRPFREGLAVVNVYGLSCLLTTLIFFAASEYRLPIMLVLIPLAGKGILELLLSLKEKRYKTLLQHAGIVILFALAVNMPTRFTNQLQSPRMDYFNIGSVLQKQERNEDAASMLQRALIIDPEFTEAHALLGDSYHALGHHEQAIEEFRLAGLDPRREMAYLDAESLLMKAQALAQSGQLVAGLKAYEEAVFIHPEPPAYVYFNIAFLNLQLGDTARAIDELTLTAEIDPEEPRVPFLLGSINEARGEWSLAADNYSKALAANPSFHLARAHAAFAYLELGDMDQAARLIEPIARQVTADPELTRLIEHICRRVGY
jgi:tetratricopeptide (TPR) repeat protein